MKIKFIVGVLMVSAVASFGASNILTQVGTNIVSLGVDSTNRFTGDGIGSVIAPPGALVKISDRVELLIDKLTAVLTGVLSVVTIVLAAIARLKSKQAAVLPLIIREIEAHNDDTLKANIQTAAMNAGVSDTLHKTVQAVTASTPKPEPQPPTP